MINETALYLTLVLMTIWAVVVTYRILILWSERGEQ
jgi:hypothetical protein